MRLRRRYLNLLIDAGRLADAQAIMTNREFAPFEGGEGRVLATWENLQLAISLAREADGDLTGALEATQAAIDTPPSLGEARHPLVDTTAIHTRLAEVLRKLGRDADAAAARQQIRTDESIQPVLEDGSVDYFATSLPDLLLFPPVGT